MLDSDWLIPKILRSDWSGPTRASFTTKILPELKILAFQNPKLKILGDLKILAFQ